MRISAHSDPGAVSISPQKLETLRGLIGEGKQARFYSWQGWRRIKSQVLEMDRHECQLCRARGRFSPAQIVHHVKHLEARPDLALSIWDPDTGERQLLSVCKACHEAQHPESLREFTAARPLTAERWE